MDTADVLTKVIARENGISTTLDTGLSIPHARIEGIENFLVAMSQDPKADSPVSKNAMINLVVSAGQPPSEIILMPDFRQKKLAEAQKWATDAGVSLTVSEDSTSLFPSDTIIAQELPPDSTVNKGTNVAITISKRKDGGADRFHNIHYELSQGGAQAKLRIVIIDKLGEREVFNGLRNPGSKIDLKVPYGGPAKVRIFVNGVQVDEREMPWAAAFRNQCPPLKKASPYLTATFPVFSNPQFPATPVNCSSERQAAKR